MTVRLNDVLQKFHVHRWSETGRTYVAPQPITEQNEKFPVEVLEKVAFGFTSIVVRCVGCGAVQTHVALGHVP